MFDLSDYVDDKTAHVVTLAFDTIAMMLSFSLALMSAYEIAKGESYLNILWYIMFVALTRWYIGEVRKDWHEVRRLV